MNKSERTIKQHLEKLRLIESVVISITRKHKDVVDRDVPKAYEALFHYFKKKELEMEATLEELSGYSELIKWRILDVIDTYLRVNNENGALHVKKSFTKSKKMIKKDTVFTDCFETLIESLEFWNQGSPRTGYISYIDNFII